MSNSPAVELIDFYRPDEREKNLYLTGIPAILPFPVKWGKLYEAFSPYGLLYGIHLVELGADSGPLEYAFVTFYSGAAARRAQQGLNGHLCIEGSRIRVQFSHRNKPTTSPLLHSSRCQELANYYLGFHGWSSRVIAMEAVPTSGDRAASYHCQVELKVGVCHGVCTGLGIGEVPLPSETLRKAQAIGVAKKQAVSKALSAAFSKVILCIVPSGRVGVHVIPSSDPPSAPPSDPPSDPSSAPSSGPPSDPICGKSEFCDENDN